MERKDISLLLDQNLEVVKTFVTMIVSDMKTEVESLRKENCELKNSLQFSQAEIDDLKLKVTEQQDAMKGMQQYLTINKDLRKRVRQLDDLSRKKHLRIDGINELENENHEETQVKVEYILNEKMGMNVKLESSNRMRSVNNDRKPRSIIIKFSTFRDRQICLRPAPKLKGTNIFVNEDVSKEILEKRTAQLDIMKEKRRLGSIAYFSGDRQQSRN